MFALYYTLPVYCELALRLVVACACGAVMGYEREKKFKDAGLRTHLIVCCSAALMMIISKYGFADLASSDTFILGTKGADPSRIAAQVISGVSFIGAGVIFHNKNNTKGLTTASGLWAIAGVGLSIGAGMYGIGIFATLLLVIVQTLMHRVSENLSAFCFVKYIIVANNTNQLRKHIREFISNNSLEIREENIEIDEDIITYELLLKMSDNPNTEKMQMFFENNDDIKKISYSIMQ